MILLALACPPPPDVIDLSGDIKPLPPRYSYLEVEWPRQNPVAGSPFPE